MGIRAQVPASAADVARQQDIQKLAITARALSLDGDFRTGF